MRVMNIIHDSVVDGEGLRTVVFFAGCPHRCLGCHNPQSWNMCNGSEMNTEEIVKEIAKNPLTDVTFSGGDPFFQAAEVKIVAKAVKALKKNLWIYTGYTLEEIQSSQNNDMIELLHYGDVLVDGRFELEKRDLTLPFRGSSNQRIIRLKE
ncbi:MULTISPECIES: anaerobic ribonucleoside-triphosphate reductase activating protein [Bacillus cereus group]|uniref:Anaerobic ribonucleoside-triphosphate reductase-activating protein n=1 Tax=Bacillus cereus TaxID=1396 RepID=A0AA44QAR1_BACCE|nr:MULTISPECIES: anaerobic ribonucleoside-triphosphate reductase activating protein [Bacillus cereus group]PFA22526.1 anaerobic ribonucleoside-triphosphate reductase activating protein [Bacillus cereus]PFN06526.1 anaerobic ribonucleoside-triphosphate reductase activating protein [Bacillus cereus]PFO84931.1 anaerobic ribonucleoside-triphosphate reductase activating protein [Bacillus cereus]PFR24196.1 anaerobic ribonucleoside-triphosphate reductase activating protein [Bacillus cereus]PFS01904.1 